MIEDDQELSGEMSH
ncbi:hypothetical protein AX774_g4747, partial [Zancudomyces culisetae]